MSSNKGLCFVIPMKDPRDSKQRLTEQCASQLSAPIAIAISGIRIHNILQEFC